LMVGAASLNLHRRQPCFAASHPNAGSVASTASRPQPLRVAFIGNSYLYFNDVPRLFQALCGGEHHVQVQDCLRGGASLKTLLEKGNGMRNKFESPNAMRPDGSYDIGAPTVQELLKHNDGWHYVVMNTYS